MPTYDYECVHCGHAFELFQQMIDKTKQKCPQCGLNKLKRLIGAGTGIIFKGSGFYETDYKRKENKSSSKNGAAASGGKSAAPASGSAGSEKKADAPSPGAEKGTP